MAMNPLKDPSLVTLSPVDVGDTPLVSPADSVDTSLSTADGDLSAVSVMSLLLTTLSAAVVTSSPTHCCHGTLSALTSSSSSSSVQFTVSTVSTASAPDAQLSETHNQLPTGTALPFQYNYSVGSR